MKLTLIFSFFMILTFEQINTRKFEITTYINGVEYREEVKSIESFEKVDLKFMKKHFYIPYHLPEKFVNKDFNNESIVVWKDENDKSNKTTNWTKTYTYDSLSRISEYEYSGCVACSNFAYKYIVTYNSKNQVVELKNTLSKKDFYEIRYDENGDIIELRSCLQNGETEKKIEFLK